jgi:hypothetical protein
VTARSASPPVSLSAVSSPRTSTGIDADAIRAIQTSMYEKAGEPLRKIVESTWGGGLDSYAKELIEEYGRGHILNGYDSSEEEQVVVIAGEETQFFLYRYK